MKEIGIVAFEYDFATSFKIKLNPYRRIATAIIFITDMGFC